MAQAKRNDFEHDAGPALPPPSLQPFAADHGYDPGGPVAQLQADLARRLAAEGMTAGAATASPAEPLIRFVSTAGGYVLLAAGYAALAMGIAHWW